VQAHDYGNDRVVARREAFKVFQGGKAGDQLGDAIGRAWAVGLLDGTTQDAAILRDMGRKYANVRALVFRQTGTAVGELEPRSRGTGDGVDKDPVGTLFAKLDGLARAAGSKQRLAMQKLCVDASPDEDPEWLGRLIAQRRGCINSDTFPRDHMIMAQALAALVAMVEG
jgi:hypothetical protein